MGKDEPANLLTLHLPEVSQVVKEFTEESIKLWTKSMNVPVAEEGYYNLVLQAIRAVYAAEHDRAELTDVIDWYGDETAHLDVCVHNLTRVPLRELYISPKDEPACPGWLKAMQGEVDAKALRELANCARLAFESEKDRRGIAGSLRLTQGKLIWLVEK